MNEVIERPLSAAGFQGWLDEGRLMATRCETCGRLALPPRAICPGCLGENLSWIELAGSGRLAAFTVVYVGPSAMNKLGYSRTNPYVTGIVEVESGQKISARILGADPLHPEKIRVGTALQVEFLREGEAQHAALAFRVV